MSNSQQTTPDPSPGFETPLDQGAVEAARDQKIAELQERVATAEAAVTAALADVEEAKQTAKKATGRERRFAVYDETYLKYVGGHYPTESAAKTAAKAAQKAGTLSAVFKVREV